jgi:hypothetical protein
MGQYEVYDFLKTERMAGNDAFFTVREIQRFLRDRGFGVSVIGTVYKNLVALEMTNYLDVQFRGDGFREWKAGFRLKQKYCQNSLLNPLKETKETQKD